MTAIRRRSSPFTPEAIADAALTVIRDEGAGALSLRRVGEVLGTTHVTLLRRCGSLEGLLDFCADRVAAGFPDIPESSDWALRTGMFFEAAYDMWSSHADLILLMRGRVWHGLNITSRFYEPAMRCMVDAGMPIIEAASLFSILYRQTIGSIVATSANRWNPWESWEALRKLGVEQFPTLTRVEQERSTRGVRDERKSYSDALRRIIDDFGRPETRDVQKDSRPGRPWEAGSVRSAAKRKLDPVVNRGK